jgi:threonine dehydrogenase-like Zn-dependent dehydrogenase
MRGIFVTALNETAILELPEPEIGPYEALVEMEACGICNSTDWKIIEGEFQGGTFPILLGHESVGRVIRVGERVRSFRVGDRVLRSNLRDEHVPYPGGRSRWGGFCERAIVTDAWSEQGAPYNAFPYPQQIVPPEIPPTEAVALITLKETISCLRRSDVGPGQSLAIVGSGPVAQALVTCAKLSGIAPVVAIGRRPRWAEAFARLGADAYVAAGEEPLKLSEVPPTARTILEAGGFDRAIEAVGSAAALARCLEVVRPNGRVNVYGVAPASAPHPEDMLADPRVYRSRVVEAEAHEQLLAWVANGKVQLADWISHSMPWTDYQRGLEMVQDKRATKVALVF